APAAGPSQSFTHSSPSPSSSLTLPTSQLSSRFIPDPPHIPAHLHSNSDSGSGSPHSGLSPFRDANSRVLVLHDPLQGLAGPLDSPLDGRNGTVFVTDRVTGWPLKRSP
ncbi:hypothetical protein BaRGS_00028929, partial [Batillaria attramentaria]